MLPPEPSPNVRIERLRRQRRVPVVLALRPHSVDEALGRGWRQTEARHVGRWCAMRIRERLIRPIGTGSRVHEGTGAP